MKIDPSFQYDLFRFVLRGVRNPLIEEFLGRRENASASNSPQGWFERIQRRIDELPQLLDPDFEDADLDLLLGQVGWDGAPEVDFVEDISAATKRRLIALSVPLWKLKGTDAGLIGALRIFTGKTVLLRGWFYHRWILDEAGFWYEDGGLDPWLHGTTYTEADDELMWIILNRTNVSETDRELIYNLLTYLHPSGEHYGVIYAAFADDFGRGTPGIDLGGPDEIPANFSQWFNVGASDAADWDETAQKAVLRAGGQIKTRTPSTDIETWGPTQYTTAQITFGATASQIAAGDPEVEIRAMISGDGLRWYAARVLRSGGLLTVELHRDGTIVETETLPAPVDGTSFLVELKVEPLDAAQVQVSILVGHLEVTSHTFLGAQAYDDPDGNVRILGISGEFYVDDVIILATPNRVQYIGQKAIPPVAGLGGPQYIADPDPGLELYEG